MILTHEHNELRRSLSKFIETELDPYLDEWEQAQRFPSHDVFKKMGDAGYLGITKPEEYGGSALDWSYAAVFSETMGRAKCSSLPMAVGVQTYMATPALAVFGSDDLREEFLRPAISGDVVVSIAVSEPGAGSDVAAITTSARKDGGDYVINGSKTWITNGMEADWVCLLTNTGEDVSGHRNKSLIVVPMDLPGVSRTKIIKMGMRASDTATLHFDDVRVPRRYLIGEEGMGFTYQMQQFQEERLWCGLSSLETMELAINSTIEYTRDRIVYGKPLIDNQVIHFRMAELQTEVEALRALCYRAVDGMLEGNDVTPMASMVKLKAGRLLRELVDSCLQYWGGMGYSEESVISRLYRDTRLMAIGGGADEVMQSIICKHMGILPGRG